MLITMHKAEKYAVDMRKLDKSSETYFLKCFGCVRKVYNLYVDFLYGELEKAGYVAGNPLPDVALPEVTAFKKAYDYLKEADSLALANAKLDFQSAVKRFNDEYDHKSYTKRAVRRDGSGTEPLSFRGLKGMPKFHSKSKGYYSYKTNCQYPSPGNSLKRPTVRLDGNILYLPKLKTGIALIIHRPLPKDAVIGNVTVSMDTDGRMYAAVEYSYRADMDMTLRDAALAGDTSVFENLNILGLDYSQKDFYVDSGGRKTNSPHAYVISLERLAKLQRDLARMQPGSKNHDRQRKRITKLHVKIRNQRLDFVRKEASLLASVYDAVAVEDLDLRAMGQALSLGKNLHDNGFGMFRERLSRKLEEKGSVLIKVDRSFASTKTCSVCGNKNDSITLSVREWDCPCCGTHHDRDVNAAINIREEGRRIFPEYFAARLKKEAAAVKRAEALSAGRRKKKTA